MPIKANYKAVWVCVCVSQICLWAMLCFACGPVKHRCVCGGSPHVPLETIRETMNICCKDTIFRGGVRVIGQWQAGRGEWGREHTQHHGLAEYSPELLIRLDFHHLSFQF